VLHLTLEQGQPPISGCSLPTPDSGDVVFTLFVGAAVFSSQELTCAGVLLDSSTLDSTQELQVFSSDLLLTMLVWYLRRLQKAFNMLIEVAP
jgi:hypothetical protein